MKKSENVIEVSNLKRTFVTYKGFIKRKKTIVSAVDDISFNVEKGEIFGLLGQNGAGKTTTIKVLTTLLAPTGGTAKVLGFNTFGQENKIRSRINFIFGGELGVYRRLSARDNLVYFANLYQIKPKTASERIQESLELVGLTDAADKLVETYSKGMIQRLQIARGLINDPEIIFMDEPTVGLDPLGAKMLREIIKKLKRQNRTVLLTTHYMYEADELCDRIAIINKGKILILDTPQGIKEKTNATDTLEISTSPISDQHINNLKLISGVTHLEVKDNEKGSLITIKHNKKESINVAIMQVLKDVNVYSSIQKEFTLEDAYISLMEKQI